MTYWRLFYHVVWATKNREPLIHPDLARDLWRVIAGKATALDALVHAVGGTEDHVHVVASVPPRLALSEFVAQLKGGSSHFANHKLAPSEPFGWQAEYGILSFDGKQLDRMVRYVKDQRQHHLDRTTVPILERAAADELEGRGA